MNSLQCLKSNWVFQLRNAHVMYSVMCLYVPVLEGVGTTNGSLSALTPTSTLIDLAIAGQSLFSLSFFLTLQSMCTELHCVLQSDILCNEMK